MSNLPVIKIGDMQIYPISSHDIEAFQSFLVDAHTNEKDVQQIIGAYKSAAQNIDEYILLHN